MCSALRQLCWDYGVAFEQLPEVVITAYVQDKLDPETGKPNIASTRVLEACGFEERGRVQYDELAETRDHLYVLNWSLLREKLLARLGETETGNERIPVQERSAEIKHVCEIYAEGCLAISLDAQQLEWDLTTPKTSWLVVTREPVADFNWGYVETSPTSSDDLETIAHILKQPPYNSFPSLICVNPEDPELAQIAKRNGLESAGTMPIMRYDVDPRLQPEVLKLARVETVRPGHKDWEKVLEDAISLQQAGFDFPLETINRTLGSKVAQNPNVNIFVGYDMAGKAVTTTMVLEHEDCFAVWNMATDLNEGRKGYGKEVLEYAMREIATDKKNTVYLLATEAGTPLYEKIGFKTLGEVGMYILNEGKAE